MYGFEQMEEVRLQLAKEYSFIGNIVKRFYTKGYTVLPSDLLAYEVALERIDVLRNKLIV